MHLIPALIQAAGQIQIKIHAAGHDAVEEMPEKEISVSGKEKLRKMVSPGQKGNGELPER